MSKKRRRRVRSVLQAVRRGVRALVIVASAVAAGGAGARAFDWVRAHPYFAVREIDVATRGRVDAETLMAWAGLAPGMSVWNAEEATVEARLLGHPRIRAASEVRQFPGQVRLRVEERTPVAILFADDQRLVAEDGVAFPPLPGEATADLPYITGLSGKDPAAAPVVARLRSAAQLAVAWGKRSQWPAISEIRPAEDELLVFALGTPLAIRFGAEARGEDFGELAAVLELWRGRETQVAAIDLTLAGQAVLTMRNRTKTPPALRASQPPSTAGRYADRGSELNAPRAFRSPKGRAKAVSGRALI